MSNNISGKVVVITGASSGLGEATARHLSKLGAKVVLAARRKERLEQLVSELVAAGGEAVAYTTDVTRADAITVRYLDRQARQQELTTEGLLAVCIQHEMDHLEGKLFVDYLSPLKREMVRKKLAKQRRHAA